MALGMPLELRIEYNRVPGLCTTYLKFRTVFFNGATGRPKLPQMKKGLLKQRSNLNKLVSYVRNILPATHALSMKGWTALPFYEHVLPDSVAVPA